MVSPVRTTIVSFAATAIALLALSGCSAGTPSDAASHSAKPTHSATAEQSTTAACASLKSSMTTVAQDLQSSYATLSSDPAAAEQKLQALTDTFTASLGSIDNPAVKKAATDADTALVALNDDVKAVLADPKSADVAKIQTDATAVSTTFTALGKVCP